jgi:HEAT repeat protein
MRYRTQGLSKSFMLTMTILVIYFYLLPCRYLRADNVDELIQQLNGENVYVQMYAAKKLGDRGDTRAVQPLIAALKDEKAGIRAADALVQIGKPSVDLLIVALKDENPLARRNAAMALGEIGDIRAINSLIGALKDEDPIVRRNSARALGELRNNSAIEPLIAALKDKVGVVRREAALALGDIKDKRAVKPLMNSLGDSDAIVRINATTALKEMGIPETAIADLQVKAEDGFNSLIQQLKDRNRNTRAEAAKALSEIKDARAVDPLIHALNDDESYVRWQAARALGKIKDTRAAGPLINALQDDYTYVRKEVAEALGEIKDARAVEPLLNLLKYDDTYAREWASKSLIKIGTPVVENLLNAPKENNLKLVADSYYFFICRGESGTETILIEALNKYGTKKMTADFMNCGNSQLKEAAQKWAENHGYKIEEHQNAMNSPIWNRCKSEDFN